MANGSKSVTIEMVASEAGVSKTTVSFVLNNNPTISAATRERVLNVIKQMGYHPNVNARNLSSQKTRTICVLVPEVGRIFEDPYFARAISGVYDEIEAAEYNLILKKASLGFASAKEYLSMFRRSEIAGMLYIGSTLNDKYLIDFVESRDPFVQVNSHIPGIDLPYVVCDNQEMGYLATKHLIDFGHRRIAHIAGSQNTITALDRHKGYARALSEAGIAEDSSLVVEGHYSREISTGVARAFMEMTPRPTAIYAANDVMALGALDALNSLGLMVPKAVSVVGSDNIDICQFANPPLTTVNMPIYEIARAAVRMLFDLIGGKAINGNAQQIMDVHLIERESSGAARVVSANAGQPPR